MDAEANLNLVPLVELQPDRFVFRELAQESRERSEEASPSATRVGQPGNSGDVRGTLIADPGPWVVDKGTWLADIGKPIDHRGPSFVSLGALFRYEGA